MVNAMILGRYPENHQGGLDFFPVEEAIHVEHMTQIQKMIQKGYSKEAILDLDYTEEEYLEAEALLLQKA